MDSLVEVREGLATWSLQSDRKLLTSIQDLSSDILSAMQKLEMRLMHLEKKTASLVAAAGVSASTFRYMCQSRYIEQEVESGPTVEPEASSANRIPIITPENFRQIVHPKYREVVALASAAFDDSQTGTNQKPLPHIFGSPEYLQDASFGIGNTMGSSRQARTEEIMEQQAFEAVPTLPASEAGDVASSDESPVDFRSMLEAALRGETHIDDEDRDSDSTADNRDAGNASVLSREQDIKQSNNGQSIIGADVQSASFSTRNLEDVRVLSQDSTLHENQEVSLQELLAEDSELFADDSSE